MRVTVLLRSRPVVTDVPGVKDRTDCEILDVLAADGRITWQDLARRVHLSPNAAAERVRRLEQRGVIAGWAAVVDPAAIGRPLEAFVDVTARPDAERAALEGWLAGQPGVVDAVHLTGPRDYVLHVHCRDAAELDDLLMRMKRDAAVAATETRVVLRHL